MLVGLAQTNRRSFNLPGSHVTTFIAGPAENQLRPASSPEASDRHAAATLPPAGRDGLTQMQRFMLKDRHGNFQNVYRD